MDYEGGQIMEENFSARNQLETTEILTRLPEENPNPVFILARDLTISYINPAAIPLLEEWGIQLEEKVPELLVDPLTDISLGDTPQEIEIQVQDKVYLFSVIFLADKDYLYLYGKDITGLKDIKNDIVELTNYDLLLGLPNRNLFVDRLEQLILKSDPGEIIAVLFIDIDDFKKVNKIFDHRVGDQLLIDVVNRLKKCTSDSDTLARLGGDQFGMILNDMTEIKKVNKVLEKIKEEFTEAFVVQSESFDNDYSEIIVTLSIGIALYPEDGTEVEDLIKNSETAMHQERKRNQATYNFYAENMNQELLREVELEAKLSQAIDRKEFVLHYQPQLDAAGEQVIGVEALIRWKNEELGFVSPGEFIPLAETTGLILEIGDWVLKQACQTAQKLRKQGFKNIKMGVNLSSRQFEDEELLSRINNSLATSGLPPALLNLEMTESAIMEDVGTSVNKLAELKEKGIKISIDDFGTGYSSLSYLKVFPLDTLKIDRAFIKDIPGDQESNSLTRAIISLAHNLGLKVIAEGAETEEQVNFLAENNCDEVQGYYYSKPLPEPELIKFLESYHLS